MLLAGRQRARQFKMTDAAEDMVRNGDALAPGRRKALDTVSSDADYGEPPVQGRRIIARAISSWICHL